MRRLLSWLAVVQSVVMCAKTIHCQLARCSSDGVTIEQITTPAFHAEGPHWEPRHQKLYFVDISNQTVSRYDPSSAKVTSIFIDGGPVSLVIATRKDGWFFVGRGLDLLLINWNGVDPIESSKYVASTVDKDKPKNRFNDGKSDAVGKMWLGTMGPEDPDLLPYQGSLYSFSKDKNLTPKKHLIGVSVSNGLGWNKNDTLMYYIDSFTRNIDVFDFDLLRGSIRNRRIGFSLSTYDIPGVPDGLAVDENDHIWVAVFGGGAILQVDPSNGNLLRTIRLPVSYVTSCAFGGPSLNVLYVTTSRRDLTGDQLKLEPLAGSVFALHGLGVKGQRKSNAANYIR